MSRESSIAAATVGLTAGIGIGYLIKKITIQKTLNAVSENLDQASESIDLNINAINRVMELLGEDEFDQAYDHWEQHLKLMKALDSFYG